MESAQGMGHLALKFPQSVLVFPQHVSVYRRSWLSFCWDSESKRDENRHSWHLVLPLARQTLPGALGGPESSSLQHRVSMIPSPAELQCWGISFLSAHPHCRAPRDSSVANSSLWGAVWVGHLTGWEVERQAGRGSFPLWKRRVVTGHRCGVSLLKDCERGIGRRLICFLFQRTQGTRHDDVFLVSESL